MPMEPTARAVRLEPQGRTIQHDLPDGTSRPSTLRPTHALGALLTAVKVGLAVIAILVILPAALAAQAAVAR